MGPIFLALHSKIALNFHKPYPHAAVTFFCMFYSPYCCYNVISVIFFLFFFDILISRILQLYRVWLLPNQEKENEGISIQSWEEFLVLLSQFLPAFKLWEILWIMWRCFLKLSDVILHLSHFVWHRCIRLCGSGASSLLSVMNALPLDSRSLVLLSWPE